MGPFFPVNESILVKTGFMVKLLKYFEAEIFSSSSRLLLLNFLVDLVQCALEVSGSFTLTSHLCSMKGMRADYWLNPTILSHCSNNHVINLDRLFNEKFFHSLLILLDVASLNAFREPSLSNANLSASVVGLLKASSMSLFLCLLVFPFLYPIYPSN